MSIGMAPLFKASQLVRKEEKKEEWSVRPLPLVKAISADGVLYEHQATAETKWKNHDEIPTPRFSVPLWSEGAAGLIGALIFMFPFALFFCGLQCRKAWRSFDASRCVRRLQHVKKVRCIQRSPYRRQTRWNVFFVYYLLVWHSGGALAMEIANQGSPEPDSPVEHFWAFEPGEVQHVQSLMNDAVDRDPHVFMVWMHGHDSHDRPAAMTYDVRIQKQEPWEPQLLSQLNFLQHFGPRFWHRVTPTPYFTADLIPHLIVWQEISWRLDYGIFLTKFVDRSEGEGTVTWNTLLVQKQNALVPMERIFNALLPDHGCDSNFRCTIQSRRTYVWPEGGFFANGALLVVLHEPKEEELDSICSQVQKPHQHDDKTWSIDAVHQEPGEDDYNSIITLTSSLAPSAEVHRHQIECKQDHTSSAAWSYGQELLRRDISFHRQTTSATTRITGGRQIFLELEGLVEHQDDSCILIHMHGIRDSHLETKSRIFNMARYADWADLYLDITNAWVGQIGFFQEIQLVYVTPQPYEVREEGRDGLHIIVDIAPERGGFLQLFQVDVQFGRLPQEKPIFESVRCFLEREPCSMMIEVLGFATFCGQPGAVCRCRSGATYYEGPQLFINYNGAGLGLEARLIFESPNEGENDINSMMTRGRPGRGTIIRVFFLYREGDEEPAVIQRFDPERVPIPGNTETDRIIYQYEHCEAFGGETRITLHEIYDQPPDLLAFRAKGYVLADEDARPEGKSLILADIGFYVAGNPMTLRGPRPNEEWREAKFIAGVCTRVEVLRELQIFSFCSEDEDVCSIWHRGILWGTEDLEARVIRDGDFFVASILQRNTDLPLQTQWRFAQEECEVDLAQLARQAENEETTHHEGNSTLPVMNEEDLTEDLPANNEGIGLLQIKLSPSRFRLSASRHAFLKLPPPGNGKTSFCDRVEFWDGETCHTKHDLSCSNPFLEGICTLKGDDEARRNPFFQSFVHETRFNQAKPIYLADDLSQDFLPFRSLRQTECGIDLTQVEALRDFLAQHMTIPELDFTKTCWNAAALPWVALTPWSFQQARSLHLYTDGSRKGNKSGAGVVLFVSDGYSWYYGGSCKHRLNDGSSNFQAEMYGSLIGLRWIWDILRCFAHFSFPMPEVWFYYDCEASGKLADGEWQGSWNDPIYKAVRSLSQIIEKSFNIEIHSRHERGHSGNPGNEAADSIARESLQLEKRNNIWDFLCRVDVVELLQWIWVLEDEELSSMTVDGVLQIPKTDAVYEPKVAQSVEGEKRGENPTRCCDLDMNFVTYNAMTLRTGKRHQEGPGYLRSLFKQCHDEKIHFLAIQETRIQRECLLKDPDYFFVHSVADKKGNGGMMFAWSRNIPFAVDHEGTQIFLQEEDVSIIHSSEQILFLKIENRFLCWVLLSVHCPHSGYDDATIEAFWKVLEELFSRPWNDLELVFLGDVNARMGQTISKAVGPFGAEEGTKASECFADFLEQHSLWLPATFESTHRGEHHTWYLPNGSGSRIDFCAIPCQWASFEVQSEVRAGLGIHGSILDHQPVLLNVKGKGEAHGHSDPWNSKRKSRIHVDLSSIPNVEKFKEAIKRTPSYSWDLDVHRHVEYLNRSIVHRAKKLSHKPMHIWKEHLQEDTWAAIHEKALVRKEFSVQRTENRTSYLQLLWDIWKGRTEKVPFQSDQLKASDFRFAKILRDFRKASIKAQTLVRRDDNVFLKSSIGKVETAAHDKNVKLFWQELKRFLPKHRSKKQGSNVRQKENLRSQWAPHLCQMEAGSIVTAESLYRNCIERQNTTPGVAPSLAEIPSLLAIEWSLRKAKPGKQGGMDGLEPTWFRRAAKELAPIFWRISLKQSLWGVEAIQFKGGSLAMLKKPGTNPEEASGYRGILLSAEGGKRFQALTRMELIAHLNETKPSLQIGGFQNMEPAYGAHFVRSYMRICSAKKLSCVRIFVDLKAAYHSLIRQFLTGQHAEEQSDLETVFACLEKEGFNADDIQRTLAEPCILEQLKVSSSLRSRMREYNQDTWANLLGSGSLIRTCKGSRPGSPLADVQFGSLMGQIGHILQDKLEGNREIQQASACVNLDPAIVIWADDLCVTFPIQEPHVALETTAFFMTEIQDIFAARGLTVNYKKGRSEAVVTVCGQGARGERKKMLTQPHLSVSKYLLRLEGRYRHLGTYHECGGKLNQEIIYRVALTWSSFKQLRHILSRQTFDLQVRLRLVQSLLLSKLLYGAGSWEPLPKRLMKKLHGCYLSVLRYVVGKTQTKTKIHHDWPDERILAEYKMPSIRAQLAISRLAYARRIWRNGGATFRDILVKESQVCSSSWLEGLREDLAWLYEVQGTEWGRDFNSTAMLWEEGKPGWKSFIKGAQRRHTLQESLTYNLKRHLGIGGTICTDYGEVEEGWLCGCGAWFSQWRSLQVHRHKKHGIHNRTYDMVSGSICPACLLQMWSPQRLQMHLNYQPKNGKGNKCYSFIAARQMTRDEETPETDLPLQGIQRRDAIRCEGPLCFGMHQDDETYARRRIEQIESTWAEKGQDFPMDCLDDKLSDAINAVFEDWGPGWENDLVELERSAADEFHFAVNLLFCGGKFQWKSREEQIQWKAYLELSDIGRTLCEWFDLRLRLAFIERAKEIQPEETKQSTAHQVAERDSKVLGWIRSISSLRKDAGNSLGFSIDDLRKPKASIKSLLLALKQCR